MNEDFVTEGLRDDRYLKAVQLLDRFEDELRGELERVGDEIVAANPDLFVEGTEPSWNNMRSSRTIIAFARVDYVMDRRRTANEGADRLKLNISVRWMNPEKLGHHDVDGALTVTSYKVKNAPSEDYERVRAASHEGDWPVHFAADHFANAPGIVYVPVEDAPSLQRAHEVLKDHFTEFGELYGAETA